MGSSDEANTPAINPAVGGLVWVRRRNGSWWPGRIVGLDELTGDNLVSPRSGTPVKLLGREDASVDWYNLERSKRVKAFRCGDYDKCIEKAKAAATGSRRVVKYARREDAILHALELETPRQSNLAEFSSKMDNIVGYEDDSSYRASPIMSNSAERYSDSQDTSTSAHELSQSGISFEESAHEMRPQPPNDSEDDGPGVKRMRGLEDLGLNIVNVQNNVRNEPEQDKHIVVVNGKDAIPVLKRKSSQVVRVPEFLKKKRRHRTIAKVLESTYNTLVSVPIMCVQIESLSASFLHGALNNEYSLLECHGSKKSVGNGISSMPGFPLIEFSDGLFDVPFVEEDQAYAAGFSSILSSPSGKLGAYDSMSEEMERGASQWQSKRKRNARHTNKTIKHDPRSSEDPCGEGNDNLTGLKHIVGTSIVSDLHVISMPDRVDTSTAAIYVNQHLPTEPDSKKPYGDDIPNGVLHVSQHLICTEPDAKKTDVNDTSNTVLHVSQNLPNTDETSSGNLHTSQHLPNREHDTEKADVNKTSNRDLHLSQHLSNTEPDSKNTLDLSRPDQISIPYRQSRFSVDIEHQTEDLHDVVLEVKSDNQPRHVPLVSLMSKFNRKAIIGHPLPIEAMKEGSSYQLIKGSSSSASRKHKSGYGVKSKKTRRSSSSKTKKSSLSLIKTRKLSALNRCQMLTEARSLPIVEKINTQAVVACIPLQVVFSRLKEAVGGSSRSSQRVPTSSIL